MVQVANILLGWILGLASPLILDANSKREQRHALTVALTTELREVQFQLVNFAYVIAERQGNSDRKLIEWVLSIHESHTETRPEELNLEALRQLLKATDAQLAYLGQKTRTEAKGTIRGLTVKKIEARFLDSQIGNLAVFSPTVQQAILHVRSKLAIVNEEIEQGREWMRMTYDASITGSDHESVKENLEKSYDMLGRQARITTDLITKTLAGI